MTFKELLEDAKTNPRSEEQLMEMFRPLLIKESLIDGRFDEDLYQELLMILHGCIRSFRV